MSSNLALARGELSCATCPRIHEQEQDTSCLRNVDEIVLPDGVLSEPSLEENESKYSDSAGTSDFNGLLHEDMANQVDRRTKNQYVFNCFNQLLLSKVLLETNPTYYLDTIAYSEVVGPPSETGFGTFSAFLAGNIRTDFLYHALFMQSFRSRLYHGTRMYPKLEREPVLFTQEARKFLRNQPMLEYMVRAAIQVVESAIILEGEECRLSITLKMDPECDTPDLRLVVESGNPDFDELTNLWEGLSKKIHDRILKLGKRNNLSTAEIDSILDTFTLSVLPKRNRNG